MTATDVHEVAVDVRKQSCLLRNKHGLLTLLDSPAYQSRHLAALTDARLVTDNQRLALLHLIDSHCHAIYLLSRKCIVHSLDAGVAKLLRNKVVDIAYLSLNPLKALVHSLHHSRRRQTLQAERPIMPTVRQLLIANLPLLFLLRRPRPCLCGGAPAGFPCGPVYGSRRFSGGSLCRSLVQSYSASGISHCWKLAQSISSR